jgi:hypothetical protein
MEQNIKYVLDAVSVALIAAAYSGFVTHLAAFFSIIWLGLQIYDRIKYGPKR